MAGDTEFWTDQKKEFLRENYLKMSKSKLAAMLKTSKSAVTGKANRMGLSSSLRSPIVRNPDGSRKGPAPKKAAQVKRGVGTLPAVARGGAAALDIQDVTAGARIVRQQPSDRNMCQWPFGDPKHPDFRFCGEALADLGRPYCAKHTKAARSSLAASPWLKV